MTSFQSPNPLWAAPPPPTGHTHSQETLQTYFTYHAPTDVTRPQYAAIEQGRCIFERRVRQQTSLDLSDVGDRVSAAEVVRNEALAFAMIINKTCPTCTDTLLAIHHLRMAVAGINQSIFQVSTQYVPWGVELARCVVIANRAIALGGL